MSQARILIHQLNYKLSTGHEIFHDLSLALSTRRVGLVGRNGVGKTSLLKLILGENQPLSGAIQVTGTLSNVAQHYTPDPHQTVASLLDCENKIAALQRIYAGSIDESDFNIVGDDWQVEMRIRQQMTLFNLNYISLQHNASKLSGGELTRLMLIKAFSSNADFLLLDEPTNHLDTSARQQLYDAINLWKGGLIVVSHDRQLLNMMDEIIELSSFGAKSYGGNYDTYCALKELEQSAAKSQLQDAKKLMERSKDSIQTSCERHVKKQSYGRQLRKSGSVDKLTASSKKGSSERTQSKMLIKEERLLKEADAKIKDAIDKIEISDTINVSMPATQVPPGKMILNMEEVTFSYPDSSKSIIHQFNFTIQGPARVALTGDNGSGKTTLVKLILDEIPLDSGRISLGTNSISYLDQRASLLNPADTILDNYLRLNKDATVNDAHRSLASFLFKNTTSHKRVNELSGGEKLRALLACVLMASEPPQLLILDEPTNHLDLHSIKSIGSALNHYRGAMLVISHDQHFLRQIGIDQFIKAPYCS